MAQDTKKKRTVIPGTKLSVNNTQLLISSGIPSFDDIIGGGLPVGTVTLIEEDTCGTYSKLMLQYFIAEGVVCGHSTFVGSQELDSSALVSALPAVINVDEEILKKPVSSMTEEDKLVIAWRYKNVPTNQTKPTKQFGHYYDLSKVMDSSYTDKADILCWTYSERPNSMVYTFDNPAYHELLEHIKKKIDEGSFSVAAKTTERSILRVALQSIGSPLWLPNNYDSSYSTRSRDLDMFLFCLRALIRSSFASVLITIPSKIIPQQNLMRCIHSSDAVIRLQSFTGTELENNSALADYQGFFHVVKLPGINSLVTKEIGPVDFAFKLRRKKFCIEELHLPPELQESNEREQDEIPSMGCGSTNKHLFEF